MAKLTRRPCEKCEADTLHRGPICVDCGTLERMPQYHEIRNKAFRRQAARLRQRFGKEYDSKAASPCILGPLGIIEAKLAATTHNREHRRGDNAPPSNMTQARFGRGRERTKV